MIDSLCITSIEFKKNEAFNTDNVVSTIVAIQSNETSTH
jgi:hypothetical protein